MTSYEYAYQVDKLNFWVLTWNSNNNHALFFLFSIPNAPELPCFPLRILWFSQNEEGQRALKQVSCLHLRRIPGEPFVSTIFPNCQHTPQTHDNDSGSPPRYKTNPEHMLSKEILAFSAISGTFPFLLFSRIKSHSVGKIHFGTWVISIHCWHLSNKLLCNCSFFFFLPALGGTRV